MEFNEKSCSTPAPRSSAFPDPSSLLRDVSNLRTPRSIAPAKNFATPTSTSRFFSAVKETPRSYASSVRHNSHYRPSTTTSKRKTATARRIKAFELEQSQSSRKAQIKKEQSLKSLAKSLTTWLNFLFQNPTACGCDSALGRGLDEGVVGLGKREVRRRPGNDGSVEVDSTWRCPKRRRDSVWGGGDGVEIKEQQVGSISKNYSKLMSSLDGVCSFDDLHQRMRLYLSLGSCIEIFDIMTLVVKNIDNGRLKMKSHCPIVTDFGMKEKATRILMCYNPIWLRIGLHIIFGGDTLLPGGDVSSEQELAFLKTMIEKQFFSHAGLAKSYAYNKMVDGLYRPGYYESLGNIILKRFLLLVLTLDRAKSLSALPLAYGIDGIDGGSPLLFEVQSNIKSSAQLINDFLSPEVMHGEGNLLAHLVIIGYKVSYQQSLLVEYEFRVTDLFADFRDGMRLCRAIQLLQNDSSILLKMVNPSDSRKKRVTNCGIALKWLKNSGVNLFDEDGIEITEDDIASGDKELTISLLWNMFVHLQLPLLINKKILLEETFGIRGTHMELSSSSTTASSPLDLLLDWLKAVCAKYDHKIENFSSLVDGRAIWCLLDCYFRKELSCPQSSKDPCRSRGEESIMSANDYTDTVHNFMLSQKLATLLGSFPEVLHTSELLEHSGAISDKSVTILVVFLSSQLAAKKAVDQLNFHKLLGCNCQSLVRRHSRVEKSFITSQLEFNQEQKHGHSIEVCADAASNFKSIRAWWQDMAERNSELVVPSMISESFPIEITNVESGKDKQENATIIIQSTFRMFREHQKYVRVLNSISVLQTMLRAWLLAKKKLASQEVAAIAVYAHAGRVKQPEKFMQCVKFIVDKHNFIKLRRSAIIIQKEARIWMDKRHIREGIARDDAVSSCARISGAIVIQKHTRGWITRGRYKVAQKERVLQLAATKVQRHIRRWSSRRQFLNLRQATIRIQRYYRCLRCLRVFQQLKTTQSAISIQSCVRGWLARKETERRKYLLCVLQKYCWGWLIRKRFLRQKQAVTKIQSAIRCFNCCKALCAKEAAAIEIQRFVRGQMTRKRLLGSSGSYAANTGLGDCLWSSELQIVMSSVLKLQRWWKGILLCRLRMQAAIVIQSHVRVWISKRRTSRKRHHIIVIQSHWRGYVARKESKGQLLDLRLRMQKSARNVDDRMRIINKLKVAVSELLSMKSMSNILHICQTLDRTTQHSQRCCEELVGAGAIAMLLKLMRSVSRSIPDQEVLKHALSTLRNLSRYPHLVETLIDSTGSVDTIFTEFLRNKEEGYFIAAAVIRKISLNSKGIEAFRRSPGLFKRLDSLVEELKRKKVSSEMRNPRGAAAETRREVEKRRLREAAELLKLISSKL
ncbi:Abnormal spindle-like microcephaly-associated protein homolog [Linum perenne]